MDGLWQKLRRANRHLQALSRASQRFKDGNPYRLDFSIVREQDGTYGVIKIKVLKPVPGSLGLIAGDICNNLRSALDHLLWRLRTDVQPSFDGSIYFPIIETEPDISFYQKAANDIARLTRIQKAKIEGLQPYKRGNNFLAILKKLNNRDKHRLIPVITVQGQLSIISIQNLVIPPRTAMEIPTLTNMPIEDDAELWRINLGEDMSAPDMRVNARLSYDFMFGTVPTIADRHFVRRTLLAIRNEVRYALGQFESP